eukprot:CAMPEP_0171678814 /NCGR_PEP_ID=MMETSP0990-20121206/55884_1 /TAXON_ID=483369 /ORGANISM="non described non described, Strain CCMP2098" /LENGTH=62 /DNA_ID=CAMNT_0012265517 /DNA_START=642 /DNA_END=827 /DNA_ORIENTATION=+
MLGTPDTPQPRVVGRAQTKGVAEKAFHALKEEEEEDGVSPWSLKCCAAKMVVAVVARLPRMR